MPWTFYPAFIATLVSVIRLSDLATHTYDKRRPRNLSEIASSQPALQRRFRNVLLLCSLLFGITLFGFIIPGLSYRLLATVFVTSIIASELLVALVPARGKVWSVHYAMGLLMGIGMLLLAYLFYFDLDGGYKLAELSVAFVMSVLGALTMLDRRKFIFYEMPFIFLSHISILVAAVALK